MAGWISAMGSVGHFMADAVRSLRDVNVWPTLTAEQMLVIGVKSVPIAVFIAAFTGVVMSMQASYTLTGAVPLYFVGTAVGKSLLLELGPVLTGLALAGRVGANIAAELGTMRVTEQVDALETLAYDPHSYLVVPRVLAASMMFPVIVALASGCGIVTGWLTAINLLDLSSFEFFKGMKMFYDFKDVWYGLVKSISFGFCIALIGCMQGLSVRGGAEGVGRATTQAVVQSAAMILVLDAVWAVAVL
ncbi:MAG: ABC transporter permease [Gemmatimonadetes bacterium]|nr:ABC transporter permease [Gemmatimonadota bacterium]